MAPAAQSFSVMGEEVGPMIDSAVAGAGPAGLAVSAALDDLQIDHVVLNADGSDRDGVPGAGTRCGSTTPGG